MALNRLRLRKSSKLQRKSEFERLKSAAFRRAGSFMAVSVAPGEGKFARCGVICSRKFHKHAVVRNRARRILSEAVRLLKPRMQSCRILLIPRRKICSATMPQVKENLERALIQAGIRIQNIEPDPGSPQPELR